MGTKEGNTFSLTLRKSYNHNEIWTVSSHSQLNHSEDAIPREKSIKYQVVDSSSVSPKVKKQTNEKIKSKKEEHSYFKVDETVYVLRVAPKGQSIDC